MWNFDFLRETLFNFFWPTVIKYSDLVTSVAKPFQDISKEFLMVIKRVQEVYKRKVCSNNIVFSSHNIGQYI